MNRCKTALIGAVIITLLTLSSCDSLPGFLTGEEMGFVALQFSLTGDNTLDVSSVRIDLSSNDSNRDFSEAFDLNESSLSAYGFIPEVPVGNWYVDIRVYNSAGGLVVEDTLGDVFQVIAGEITTITATCDPSSGSDMTITTVSSSTVQPAVHIDTDQLDGCFILCTDGDADYNIGEVNYLAGTGGFQAASAFSFIYPDGSEIGYSANRSIYADLNVRFDDYSFSCMRSGGGYGTSTVRVTDVHGVSAQDSWTFPHDDVYAGLAYSTNPHHTGSISVSMDTPVTWEPVNDTVVQSIIVIMVEKAFMGSSPADYTSPATLSGNSTGFTLGAGTLSPSVLPAEYEIIILTFDRWIDDTTPFSSITNFYPDSLIESLLSYTGYNFDFIGISYSTFVLTS